ncbi:uncharacterized protein LOC143290865 [Babylonia areolata]|uniref:uncharacterized protein LOC143290865 n=1 Tax=Babylonia areolata TaxID=304850 RepID=UPI003FD0C1B7
MMTTCRPADRATSCVMPPGCPAPLSSVTGCAPSTLPPRSVWLTSTMTQWPKVVSLVASSAVKETRSVDAMTTCADVAASGFLEHVEAKQPGAGRSHPTGPDTDTGHTSSSSWLPGIVATVTVNVMAVVAILGLTAVHRFRQTQGRYQPAPGRDVTDSSTNSEQATRVSTPVQVSNEDMAADQVVNGSQRQMSPLLDTAATQGDHVQYGIAETDPAAPSSAAFWHVQHQQYSC